MGKSKKTFGDLLREKIKQSGMSQSAFYRAVDITKPYFYDILSGKVNPPPPDVQFRMVDNLELDEDERTEFFNLAAEERKEIPADIVKLITDHSNELERIRSHLTEMFARKEIEIWQL